MTVYSRRGLHGQVVDALGLRVLSGEVRSGSLVDPESLSAEFGVSRTVIREALKVLAAKGLVDARPRTGTHVTERARWQLLDTDVMNWRSRGTRDPLLLLELGEVRQIIEPAAARMAASRRTDGHLATLRKAVDTMVAWDGSEFGDLVRADLDFHRTVLLAAGNELLQHFEVILEPALQARDSLLHDHNADRAFVNSHLEVLRAIEAGDGFEAHSQMTRMMATAARDAETALAGDPRAQAAIRERNRNGAHREDSPLLPLGASSVI